MKKGTTVLQKKEIIWPIIDIDQVCAFDHAKRAGLQIADCVASAFFKAVELNSKGDCIGEYAENLKPTIFSNKRNFMEYGIKPVPYLNKVKIIPIQKGIFKFYGYKG